MKLNTRLGIVAGGLTGAAVFVWVAIIIVLQQPTIQPTNSDQTIVVETTTNTDTTTVVTAPLESPRQLDGVTVSPDQANLYPIALMIENAAFDGVRPQFGLSSAQVVYEVVVEGGITRFMALFGGDMSEKIGPVRSARPTYLEFASEYDALYGHAGGSPEAMQAISGLGLKDLSALAADSRFFVRDGSRVAPHNLFTSNDLLTLARRDKSLSPDMATFSSWLFKADEPVKDVTPTTHSVTIDFGSGPLYVVSYAYDPLTNIYQRYNGGVLQHDAVNNQILTAKNVIVQMVPAAIPAGDDGRVNFAVTGQGVAYIVRDGQVITGTWSKTDRAGRTTWLDSNGNLIALDRGTTWIEVLPVTGTISYQ